MCKASFCSLSDRHLVILLQGVMVHLTGVFGNWPDTGFVKSNNSLVAIFAGLSCLRQYSLEQTFRTVSDILRNVPL